MRIFIVYASRHGQTRRIAERIASMARESGAETRLFEISALPRDLALATFDVIVLAGSVHFGKHAKKLEQFAIAHREQLAKAHGVFVSVSGAARTHEGRVAALEAVHGFTTKTGWAPSRIELFAGGEPYTKYHLLLRWFMVRHARKTGRIVDPRTDYDFTDWTAVERLGRSLASSNS